MATITPLITGSAVQRSTLYGNVQGDRPGHTMTGEFSPLAWDANELDSAAFRDAITGKKLPLGDFFTGQDRDGGHLAGIIRVDTLSPLA